MSVFFTSDLHLGHRLVAGLRGFASVEEHDQAVIDRWCAAVTKHDQVWVLGDIAVSSPWAALGMLAGLPGRKHLIAGNHDPCHPMHRDSHKRLTAYQPVFDSVQAFARRKVAGQDVLLSHFPYHGDHTAEVRYAQYRLRDEGAWLLHGHTHSTVQQDGRQIHVGLDAWQLELVPLDTITEMVTRA